MVVAIDDEKPRGQAGDNLAAETLGGFGPRLHRLLALAQLATASSMAAAMNAVSVPALRSPCVVARAAAKSRSTAKARTADERRDDRRQAEEEVAAFAHDGGISFELPSLPAASCQSLRPRNRRLVAGNCQLELMTVYCVGRNSCRNVSVLTSRNIGVPGGRVRDQEVDVEVEVARAGAP